MTIATAWSIFIGLLVLGTIRFCVVSPRDELVLAQDSDELVNRSLDLIERSVHSRG